ncbi:MAG: 16S rRNA (guanine(527)-N(7))-methyltransferase RsmG [Prolixibacteraceae bacterium]|nr:16S rRNA (guanine(527)-N(7))-methyltransferase RsmG [Prolixibacteraceae bacterium]
MELIKKYFPEINKVQMEKIDDMESLYKDWNEKINVISRKDIGSLYEKHVLHSLSIAKVIKFSPGTKVMDVGTGGGFPGIPLSILFPETRFLLIDSVGKKIKVVKSVAERLELKNVEVRQQRAEAVCDHFDFIVSRAVTSFPVFVSWVKDKIASKQKNKLGNGIFYLKGGDFEDEIKPFGGKVHVYNLQDFFEEEFFETKKIIYLRQN